MMILIVDYGMGNLRSVAKAFEAIGCSTLVSSDPRDFDRADRIVLPGDGAFGAGMAQLQRLGLIEPLRRAVGGEGKPFLGICLGMQLLAKTGWEHGRCEGLGWIDAEVRPLKEAAPTVRVPHIGWNGVRIQPGARLFHDLPKEPVFYFVHSYHVCCTERHAIAGMCDYGVLFVAAIEYENVFATQFHPEKSQQVGLQVLRNFVNA